MAPTERSKPPAIIITSMPSATMPMIEFCWRTFHRLRESRKSGEAMSSTTSSAKNTTEMA